MKKICIIGAGYTGMVAALRLAEQGNDITVYEKSSKLGGIAQTIEYEGAIIEKHYRHIFKSDIDAISIIKEMKLEDSLKWTKTKMGYFTDNNLYEFGTPMSLLKFKPLHFINKIRFGFMVIHIKLIKKYKNLEKVNAEEWLKKHCGQKVYEKVWEPLLISKFGNKKSEISMAWLWGKIVLRGSSGKVNSEELGYLAPGKSFGILTKTIEKRLEELQCKVKLNHTVLKCDKRNNKWNILTDILEEGEFDVIINTTSYPIALKIFGEYINQEEKEKMLKVKYTSARTVIMTLKRKLSDFYWLNIGDSTIPFGGIIEHTNMIDKSYYNNKNVVYISNYMYEDDKMYHITKEELINQYVMYLKKIYPDFSKDDIEKYQVFEENYAQPIIIKEYSNIILDNKLSEKGLYMSTMAQIYPEDRGMNYAIKEGNKIAKLVNEDLWKY